MRKIVILVIVLVLSGLQVSAREIHVSVNGSDVAAGTKDAPFKTINFAAQHAWPGDTITVHEGTYREWVDPLYGGNDKQRPTLYRAAEGETVQIKGSEQVTGWKREKKSNVWKAAVPNTIFGTFNPYHEKFWGDWTLKGTQYHLGDVYVNEVSIYEADSLSQVFEAKPIVTKRDPNGSSMLWYATVDDSHTTFYVNFGDLNPNKELVEIAARRTCFYPSREGINYITIRGFHFSQATSKWSAPTAEQIGIVATHWNKGWIIEDNEVSGSKCVGISLGKEAATGDNLITVGQGAGAGEIYKALRKGWNMENIGSHVVRNNDIHDCEQSGICGALGAIKSEIYGNHIHDIWVKQQIGGEEHACIKFHEGIDVYIHDNWLHNSAYGVWMDWMGQGSRISRNLIHDTYVYDIFYEVTHGPFLVDNNILLSDGSIRDWSEGGAFVHNLIRGRIGIAAHEWPESGYRCTPFLFNHTTEIMGVTTVVAGDCRYYNNVFCTRKDKDGYGPSPLKEFQRPVYMGDNQLIDDPDIKFEMVDGQAYLEISIPENDSKASLIETDVLGYAATTNLRYESSDGHEIVFDKDYFGNKRPSIIPGPFASRPTGKIQVWSK